MPQLYDNEKRELYKEIRTSITYSVSFYYVILAAIFVESHFESFWIFSPWVSLVFPGVCALFYFLGVVSNYKPKERFLPKPTIRRMMHAFDTRSRVDLNADRIGRKLGKIRREDQRQKRADAWRREIKRDIKGSEEQGV